MLKKIIKNFLVLILFFVFICVIININVFIQIQREISENKTDTQSDKYIKYAKLINEKYIFPLTEWNDYRSLIILPFYKIRNIFYNKAIDNVQNDKALKELYWKDVKFEELVFIYEFYEGVNNSWKKPLKENIYQYLKNLQDETNIHIKTFANTDFKGKVSDTEKLSILADLITYYVQSVYLIESRQEREKFEETHNENAPINLSYPPYSVIENNMEFIRLFDNAKQQIKEKNPIAYNDFETTKKAKENLMKIWIIREKYFGYYRERKPLDYNSEEIYKLADLLEEISDYIIKNLQNIPDSELFYILRGVNFYSLDLEEYPQAVSQKIKSVHEKINPLFENITKKHLSIARLKTGKLKNKLTKYGIWIINDRINH